MKEKHQFTGRELFSLIAPLMADSLLSVLIGVADTMMVSNVGEAAISGVALVDSISYLLINLFAAFATGGAVVVSQYLGRKDLENARESAKNLVYVSLSAALLILLIVFPLRGFLIDKIFGDISPVVKGYTEDYFVPLMLSYPFLALHSAFAAISRSERKSMRTLTVSAMMNALNIAGNAVLIFIFHMGPRGAGIASLFSRLFGAALLFMLMRRPGEELCLKGITKGPVSGAHIKRIATIAIPSGIENSVFQLGKLAVQALVASLGTSAIAINALMSNVNIYSNIPGFGLNMAALTIIGQCRGRRNFKDISYYTKLLFLVFFITTAILVIPCFIFAPQVISLYSLEPSSQATALPMMRLCLVMCLLVWPFGFIFPNVLKASGDVRFSLIASLSSMWIFRVLTAYALVRGAGMGIEAVWYAMYLNWAAMGVLYALRLRSGRWKTKEVI